MELVSACVLSVVFDITISVILLWVQYATQYESAIFHACAQTNTYMERKTNTATEICRLAGGCCWSTCLRANATGVFGFC